jgi:hypothetical protein
MILQLLALHRRQKKSGFANRQIKLALYIYIYILAVHSLELAISLERKYISTFSKILILLHPSQK